MRLRTHIVALLALSAVSATAGAQNAEWTGFYVGLNGGYIDNTTCENWSSSDPTIALNLGSCPSKSVFLGGGTIGFNWQSDALVLGLEGDWDGISSKTLSRSYDYPGGTVVPPGTFNFTAKNIPNGLGTIRARFGLAAGNWMPYLTAGVALAGGSGRSSATFTPSGAVQLPTLASFDGGRTYSSNGWTAGLGVEYQMAPAWSVKFEYLYVQLGSGHNQIANCSPAGSAACAAFGGENLQSTSNSVTENVLRLGFNYRFGAHAAATTVAAAAPVAAAPPPAPRPPPPPPPPPPSLCPNTPPGVAVDQYGCPCDVSQQMHFATNSAELTDEDKALLDKVIVRLKQLNFVVGEIDGYTDATGQAAYNMGLSERRAQAVADYLQSHGIAADRLTVKGFGEEHPIGDNATAEGRAQNRRVVIHRTNCGK